MAAACSCSRLPAPREPRFFQHSSILATQTRTMRAEKPSWPNTAADVRRQTSARARMQTSKPTKSVRRASLDWPTNFGPLKSFARTLLRSFVWWRKQISFSADAVVKAEANLAASSNPKNKSKRESVARPESTTQVRLSVFAELSPSLA